MECPKKVFMYCCMKIILLEYIIKIFKLNCNSNQNVEFLGNVMNYSLI